MSEEQNPLLASRPICSHPPSVHTAHAIRSLVFSAVIGLPFSLLLGAACGIGGSILYPWDAKTDVAVRTAAFDPLNMIHAHAFLMLSVIPLILATSLYLVFRFHQGLEMSPRQLLMSISLYWIGALATLVVMVYKAFSLVYAAATVQKPFFEIMNEANSNTINLTIGTLAHLILLVSLILFAYRLCCCGRGSRSSCASASSSSSVHATSNLPDSA
eukprot:TRINITY_DN1382_c0_g1_i1.p1 TRINITY_DN1382_c0_g1~~TRINITY_DN1382_c0_g1_i1.p1  ORF type:complete len:215 (+),score=35.75 TRINITY_DN1382_c0_g1_i1:287-931(+)